MTALTCRNPRFSNQTEKNAVDARLIGWNHAISKSVIGKLKQYLIQFMYNESVGYGLYTLLKVQ
jgi:hypothetical protein